MLDPSWEGPYGSNSVNLSTSTSFSSSALLNSVRAERLLRERTRAQERAAIVLQSAWRGRRERRRVKRELLERFESGDGDAQGFGGFEGRSRAMVVLLMNGMEKSYEKSRMEKVLVNWCQEGMEMDQGEW